MLNHLLDTFPNIWHESLKLEDEINGCLSNSLCRTKKEWHSQDNGPWVHGSKCSTHGCVVEKLNSTLFKVEAEANSWLSSYTYPGWKSHLILLGCQQVEGTVLNGNSKQTGRVGMRYLVALYLIVTCSSAAAQWKQCFLCRCCCGQHRVNRCVCYLILPALALWRFF